MLGRLTTSRLSISIERMARTSCSVCSMFSSYFDSSHLYTIVHSYVIYDCKINLHIYCTYCNLVGFGDLGLRFAT